MTGLGFVLQVLGNMLGMMLGVMVVILGIWVLSGDIYYLVWKKWTK